MRALLQHPRVYEAFQRALGAAQGRRRLLEGPADLRPGMSLLDVGCGPGGLLTELPDGVRYVGIDGDARYIDAARAAFGSRGVFVHGLIEPGWQAPAHGPFDRIVALGLLHHLDDASAHALLSALASVLAPGGRVLTLDPVIYDGQAAVRRRIILADRGEHIRDQAGYEALLRPHFDSATIERREDLLRIPYSHCVMVGRRAA